MRASAVVAALAAAGVLSALVACEAKTARPGFDVTIDVRSDDGAPLAGVVVTSDDAQLGTTGADGILSLTMHAPDGTRMNVSPICPDGFDPPEKDARLVLRSFSGLDRDGANQLSLSLQCRPRERTAAVVVRADGHPDLPVLVDGKVVARTNTRGVAHLALRRPSNTTFRVGLDTSGHPRLRPQNPETPFAVDDADEIFVFDQGFEKSKAKKRRRRRRNKAEPKKRARPIKIESTRNRRWRAL